MIIWMRRHWEAHAYTGRKIVGLFRGAGAVFDSEVTTKKRFKLESLDSAKRWVERELNKFARRRSSTG